MLKVKLIINVAYISEIFEKTFKGKVQLGLTIIRKVTDTKFNPPCGDTKLLSVASTSYGGNV